MKQKMSDRAVVIMHLLNTGFRRQSATARCLRCSKLIKSCKCGPVPIHPKDFAKAGWKLDTVEEARARFLAKGGA